jgi:hypothetical protein
MKKSILLLIALAMAPLAAIAQNYSMVPQFYSAMNFLSFSPTGQPLTNAIAVQPWPAPNTTPTYINIGSQVCLTDERFDRP